MVFKYTFTLIKLKLKNIKSIILQSLRQVVVSLATRQVLNRSAQVFMNGDWGFVVHTHMQRRWS